LTRPRLIWIVFFLALGLIIFASTKVHLPYYIKVQGKVVSGQEYKLIRTLEGNLVSTLRNNITNVVYEYDVTEFKRGDVVAFRLNRELEGRKYVEKGDTLGLVYSNEEQRNLIDLKGQYEILKAELEFYTTGQKPEDVLVAQEQWDLAKQELETQSKLVARSESLFNDGVISKQEWEIEENRYKVRELEEKIAEANYLSVTTGEKPEQEKLTRAQMEVISWQIEQIQSRLDFFTIISPFSGKLYFSSSSSTEGSLLSILDTAETVVMVPVLLTDYPYVSIGQSIFVKGQKGILKHIDDKVRTIDQRQAFLVTGVWAHNPNAHLGSILEVKIEGDQVTAWDYLVRRFRLHSYSSS